MNVRVQPVPTNVEGANAFVVQAPSGAWLAIDAAQEEAMCAVAGGGRPDFLILTHEHYDHLSGFLTPQAFAGVLLVASIHCAECLPDPAKNLSKYQPGGRPFSVRAPDIIVPSEGLRIPWEGRSIELALAPGHSPGGLLIHIDGHLFTGDTLLRDHRTVTKLPGGDRQALEVTLGNLFTSYAPATHVWPGHGLAFHLAESSLLLAMNGA